MAQEESVNAIWGTSLKVFYCPHCHSAHLAPSDVSLTTCPACLQAGVSSQPERMRREPPELVIPFAVGEQQMAGVLARWAKGVWFRPPELQADVLLGRARHCYLPLWLVDGDVKAAWRAEMGYDYEAASFRERYANGEWVSQEVTETRTRWEPRVGRLERHYDNTAVPALEEHEQWMSRLGGYDFRTRKAYSARSITQSIVRVPDHAPDAAWPDAESSFDRTAAMEARIASQADHIRNWGMAAEYENLNWTQMLVPVYVTHYREGDGVYPVWVNGQSGRIYGLKRMSQRRAMNTSLVLGAVAAFLFCIGAMLALVGTVMPAILVLGVVLGVLGLCLGLVAPVPVTWAWLGNRRSVAI